MKKILTLVIIAVMLCGTAFASNIGMEPLLNNCYNATNKTIRFQEGLSGGTVRAGLTTDSHATGGQPLSADSIATTQVTITPLPTNQLDVHIGSSTTFLYRLTGDRVLTMPVNDVSSIYFMSDNDSDGVSWICTQ